DSTVKVWDATEGKEALALRRHVYRVATVAWSPDGKRLASGGYDSTLKVWDMTAGGEGRALKVRAKWVLRVSWAPDGRHLAVAGGDGSRLGGGEESALKSTLQIWDLAEGR